MTATCLVCSAPLVAQPKAGRQAVYCSSACRQSHYRKNVTLRNAGQAEQNVTLRNSGQAEQNVTLRNAGQAEQNVTLLNEIRARLSPYPLDMRRYILAQVVLTLFPALSALIPHMVIAANDGAQAGPPKDVIKSLNYYSFNRT